MTKSGLNTEERIFHSACEVFLLYGYHGTTIRKITELSGTNNLSLNYYFRSKEKLYQKVLEYLIGEILVTVNKKHPTPAIDEKLKWFFFTELYNNYQLFEKVLKDIFIVVLIRLQFIDIHKIQIINDFGIQSAFCPRTNVLP